MKRIFGLLLALSAGHGALAAQLDQWGAVTATGTYGCAGTTCNLLDFLGQTIVDVQGGSGMLGAASQLPGGDPNGAARAEVNVLGGLAVPQLKAEAYSTANGGVTALAVGVQAYTYTGGAGNVSVSLDLTGSINDTTAPPVLSPAEEATLALLGLSAPYPDLTRIEVMGALFAPQSGFSLSDLTGLTPLGALNALDAYTQIDSVVIVEDDTNNNIQNLGNIISVNGLNPGDSFFLFTAMLASADGAGQFADSFSTLNAQFTVGGGEIVPAAVPLPAGMVLLGSALGLLLGRRRSARIG